jgi:rfaE bifunctional protein nucleotidyltransferase chain/domain/rfaE bifunctional protein kinase chain/domain
MIRLVVVGDALLDVDIIGTATRLVPDEPAPVVDVRGRWLRPGGAGLAAALLATRGTGAEATEVTLVAAFAADAEGEQLMDLLAPDLRIVRMPLTGSTVSKTRVRVRGRTVARLDDGDGRAADRPLSASVRSAVCDAVRSADAVLVADYGRGVAGHPDLRASLEAVSDRIPIVWDPHPRGQAPARGCRLVTPNLAEARGYLAGPAGSDPVDPGNAARELRHRWQAGGVAVTVAADGAVLDSAATGTVRIPVPSTAATAEGADACGAGDRFASAATAALAGGASPDEAVALAVDAASRFVAAGGAAAVNVAASGPVDHAPDDLQVRPAGRSTGDRTEPGPDDVSAFELADRIRRRGGRLVATGGCFDLIHPGHLDLLRRARAMGDALVVCVNSDDSVRRLKGPARPVIPARDRVRLLAELRSVDAVIVFSGSDPAALLDRLRPDVWVKGGDYDGVVMPEASVVRRHGGDVVLVPTVHGYSTTRLLQEVTSR